MMRQRYYILLAMLVFTRGMQGMPAEWRAMGPFGGAVAAIQVDPVHAGVVVAGSPNASLFRSLDDGANWSALPTPFQLRSVLHAFLIHPSGVYFAGLSSDSAECNGLFRSDDQGKTWAQVSGLKGNEIWSLAVFPGNANVLAAGSRYGVFLSHDGGTNWDRASSTAYRDLQPVVSLAFDPKDAKVLFAGTPHLPWKTADGGATWVSVHTGMIDDSDVFSLQVDWNQPQHILATACSGIYASLNGGALWHKMTGARDASYRTYVVSQHPAEPEVVFAGTTGGLIRSTDGGVSWKKVSGDATRAFAFDVSKPGRIFAATDHRGVIRSEDDGLTWADSNIGLCNRLFSMIGVSGADVYTASTYEGASGGLFRLNSQTGWEKLASASHLLDEQLVKLIALPEGRLYAAGYGAVLGSSDGGKSWLRIAPPPGASRLTGIYAMNQDPARLVLGATTGLYRSVDSGANWQKLILPKGATSIQSIFSVDEQTVGALSNAGVLVSADGLNWQALGPVPGDARIYGLVALKGSLMLAATSGGLMRSNDSGVSWQRIRWAKEGSTVSAICRDPQNPNVVFLAAYGVIYQSTDAGVKWTRISPEPSVMNQIRDLAVQPGETGRLFALTQHQGIFELPLRAMPGAVPSSSTIQGDTNTQQLTIRKTNE